MSLPAPPPSVTPRTLALLPFQPAPGTAYQATGVEEGQLEVHHFDAYLLAPCFNIC